MGCTCRLGTEIHKHTGKEAALAGVWSVENADNYISGHGVRVVYHPSNGTITLYRVEGGATTQMSKPSSMGYPVVDGHTVSDFGDYTCAVERGITGTLGRGERMTITSHSPSSSLIRTYIIETSATIKGALYTNTTYQAGGEKITVAEFVENPFELFQPGNIIWSYNGGGERAVPPDSDTLRKIDLTDGDVFFMENRQDYTSAAIPLADIYMASGGITVGDASISRRELRTPVQQTEDSASICIKWPGKAIAASSVVAAGQSFIVVHKGDYYCGLRGFKDAMEHLGMVMQSKIPERSYSLRWEAWGWAFHWTMDLIISELDFLQEAGVTQITIDDAWFNHPGDWLLNPEKFPNGEEDMVRLVKAIHDHGMTAILWWRPCDGGRDDSALHQEHPEYFVMHKDGSTAKLGGSGKIDTTDWSTDTGYALCPGSDGAVASQVAFINRAMRDWGFDGFKGDYVWSLPKCYNPDHHHPHPEDSTERQAEIYRAVHEAMVANDPEVFNLLCCCGAPQDYYSLQYMTQVVTADPSSVDQTRTRLKAYKALMGDCFPVTTDHNQVWYSSTVGTGGIIIEKTAFVGKEKAEYRRWLGIANTVQLHKGRFIGDLYRYGFDPYETYVVEKNGVMYYSFYRDGVKCPPNGYPDIELRGLDPDKMYRIVDYVNDRVVATNLMGDHAVFNTRFAKDLLVKAVEISTPDLEEIDPDYGFICVEGDDATLCYTGAWSNTCCATGAGASVEFHFYGTAIRWRGNRENDFGTAEVWLDGNQVAMVNAGGSAEMDVLLFEALDLPAGTHALRIVCQNEPIHLGRLAYEPAPPEVVFNQRVDARSSRITYTGHWEKIDADGVCTDGAMCTTEPGATAEMTFCGTAIRWYGKTTIDYGVAWVFLDNELNKTVCAYGPESAGKLLFERTGLAAGEHTLRIMHMTKFNEVDYLTYASTEEPSGKQL